MNRRKTALTILTLGWVLALSLPASAQIERAVVETIGLSNACRAGLEAALNSMESVYQSAISVEKQMFSITYYAGVKFDAKQLHWAADKGEADVAKIHLSAAGTIHDEGDQQIFDTGEDRFVIVAAQKLPVDVRIGIIGVVDQSSEMLKLKADDFKVLADEPPASDNPKDGPAAEKEQSHEK